MIEVKNKLGENKARLLVEMAFNACLNEPNLSPISVRKLWKYYKDGQILIANSKKDPVGWLIKIPYSNRVQELAAAYVIKEYRGKGIFTTLLQQALKYAPTTIILTFNNQLRIHLENIQGFRKSSFWEVLKLSRGKFLLGRLNLQRLLAIKKHYHTGKPIYLVYKNE